MSLNIGPIPMFFRPKNMIKHCNYLKYNWPYHKSNVFMCVSVRACESFHACITEQQHSLSLPQTHSALSKRSICCRARCKLERDSLTVTQCSTFYSGYYWSINWWKKTQWFIHDSLFSASSWYDCSSVSWCCGAPRCDEFTDNNRMDAVSFSASVKSVLYQSITTSKLLETHSVRTFNMRVL